MNRKKQELWNMFPVYCLIGCCLLIFKGGLVFGPFVFILFFGQLRQIDKEEKEYEERVIRDRRANMTPEEIEEDIKLEEEKKRDIELRKRGLVYDYKTNEIVTKLEYAYRNNQRMEEAREKMDRKWHLENYVRSQCLAGKPYDTYKKELEELNEMRREEEELLNEFKRRKEKEIERANRKKA